MYVHQYADTADSEHNIKVAKLITNHFKIDVKIRPHINVNGVKNPELEIFEKWAM